MSRPGAVAALVLGVIGVATMVFPAVFVPFAIAATPLALVAGFAIVVPAVLAGPLLGGTMMSVELGRDGIFTRWLGRERFLAFADVEDVRVEGARIALRTRHGKLEYLQLVERVGKGLMPIDGRRAEPFAEALTTRWREARRARDARALEAELAQGTRSVREWVAALEARASEPPDYRDAALPPAALAELAADPAAEPSARTAAAWLLRRLGRAEHDADALRTAALEAAHPRVRVALDAALDGDDAALAHALATPMPRAPREAAS